MKNDINIGLYIGDGSSEKGIKQFIKNISLSKHSIIKLSSSDILNKDLSMFDVLAFTGGSGSKQALSLTDEGRIKVKNYIEKGGKYLGICAGAYLATTGFDWSLGVIDVETISQIEWERGKGLVTLSVTTEGHKMFDSFPDSFEIRYANGPILKKSHMAGLRDYTVIASYSTEISENGVAPEVMKDTPAIILGDYGKGKVCIIGPHAEYTSGLEYVLLEIIETI